MIVLVKREKEICLKVKTLSFKAKKQYLFGYNYSNKKEKIGTGFFGEKMETCSFGDR